MTNGPTGGTVDEVTYGVIGVGMMGREHIANVNALPGARVVAVADPHEPSLDLACAEADHEVRRFADHRALLDAEVCDVVVVATPNMTHRAVLEDIWGRDVHVLVEKPLCTTVEDCRAVERAATDHPGLVWVGLEYRYMPSIARLIDEVRAGTVGELAMLSIREHRFPFLDKVGAWNRFNRNTGGTMVEKCCHFFDLMSVICDGRPARVMASGGQDVNHLDESVDGERPDILDNAFVIVDFDSGQRAALDLCMFAEATTNMEEVCAVGSAGKVEAFLPSGEVRVGRRADGWFAVQSEVASDDSVAYEGGHHGASFLEHRALVDHVRRGGGATPVSIADGLLSVAMGVAAHRSIDEQRAVMMDEVLGADAGEGE